MFIFWYWLCICFESLNLTGIHFYYILHKFSGFFGIYWNFNGNFLDFSEIFILTHRCAIFSSSFSTFPHKWYWWKTNLRGTWVWPCVKLSTLYFQAPSAQPSQLCSPLHSIDFVLLWNRLSGEWIRKSAPNCWFRWSGWCQCLWIFPWWVMRRWKGSIQLLIVMKGGQVIKKVRFKS